MKSMGETSASKSTILKASFVKILWRWWSWKILNLSENNEQDVPLKNWYRIRYCFLLYMFYVVFFFFPMAFYFIIHFCNSICTCCLYIFLLFIFSFFLFDLQLPVQSVPITTEVVSSNHTHGKVYSIHYMYMIKFVSDLQQVCVFLLVLI